MEKPQEAKNEEAFEIYLKGKDEGYLQGLVNDPISNIDTTRPGEVDPTAGYSFEEISKAAKAELKSRKIK